MSANLIHSTMKDINIIIKLKSNVNVERVIDWLKDKYFIPSLNGNVLIINTVLHYYGYGFSNDASNYLSMTDIYEFSSLLKEIIRGNTVIISSDTPQSLNLVFFLRSQGVNVKLSGKFNLPKEYSDVIKLIKNKFTILNPKNRVKTLLDIFEQTPIIIGNYIYYTTNRTYFKSSVDKYYKLFFMPLPVNILVDDVWNVLLRKIFFSEVKHVSSKSGEIMLYIHDISLKGSDKLFHMIVDYNNNVGVLLYDGLKDSWHSIIISDKKIIRDEYNCNPFLEFTEKRARETPDSIHEISCY